MLRAASIVVVASAIAVSGSCSFGPEDDPPIVTAIGLGRLDEVEQLLEDGADPNQKFLGETPLNDAVVAESEQMVRLLLQYGADPTQSELDPLFYLVHPLDRVELVDIAVLLLEHGSDPCAELREESREFWSGDTPLESAQAEDMQRIVDLFEQYGYRSC